MSRLMHWIDRHAEVIIVLCIIALAVFALVGCNDARSLPPGAHENSDGTISYGLSAQLAEVGGYFTWAGCIVAGLAVLACIFPLARPIAFIAGEIGTGSALIGGLFVWLSENIWLVVLSCFVAALAWAWYRRAWLRRWLDRFKAQAVKS